MRIVIVDDDPISLAHIEHQLNRLDDLEVVASFLDPMEGQSYILENDIDTVLLDVHFAGVTGLEIAEEIHMHKPNIIIALVSSYEKYAVDAFELNIIDYILKPVELDRLETTINRIRKQLKRQIKPIEQKTLHLQVSNRFEFIVGENYQPVIWRTVKTQELFLYLLQYSEVSISKEDLMEILWAEGKESFSILYTTIHHVRAVLEGYKDYIQLINDESGYRLVLNNLEIDLIEWETEILSLPDISSTSISDYEQMMKRNKGAYLDEYGHLWSEPEKFRLEELWTSVAIEIASYYKSNDLDEDAIRWYLTIIERNQVEEQVYFSLIKIYERHGKSDLVKRIYDKLVAVLDEELGVEANEYITTWYKEWEEHHKLIKS